jgi:hypothetical protein
MVGFITIPTEELARRKAMRAASRKTRYEAKRKAAQAGTNDWRAFKTINAANQHADMQSTPETALLSVLEATAAQQALSQVYDISTQLYSGEITEGLFPNGQGYIQVDKRVFPAQVVIARGVNYVMVRQLVPVTLETFYNKTSSLVAACPEEVKPTTAKEKPQKPIVEKVVETSAPKTTIGKPAAFTEAELMGIDSYVGDSSEEPSVENEDTVKTSNLDVVISLSDMDEDDQEVYEEAPTVIKQRFEDTEDDDFDCISVVDDGVEDYNSTPQVKAPPPTDPKQKSTTAEDFGFLDDVDDDI